MIEIKSVKIDDPRKEKILRDSCDAFNKKQAMFDPGHVEVTPEQHLLDYLARYIEGLEGPILSEAEAAARIAEEQRIAAARRNEKLLGKTGAGS